MNSSYFSFTKRQGYLLKIRADLSQKKSLKKITLPVPVLPGTVCKIFNGNYLIDYILEPIN